MAHNLNRGKFTGRTWHGVNTMREFYRNTAEQRETLGMRYVPEYVHGDVNDPFIMHDRIRGIYVFVAELPENAKLEV